MNNALIHIKIKPMLKHFLVVTIRNLQRDIGYTLVNVMGLGTGIAVSLLLFFWVRNESF